MQTQSILQISRKCEGRQKKYALTAQDSNGLPPVARKRRGGRATGSEARCAEVINRGDRKCVENHDGNFALALSSFAVTLAQSNVNRMCLFNGEILHLPPSLSP